jgi:SAM-dependent methyltransferase
MTASALPGTPAEVTGQVVRGFTEAAGGYDAGGTEFFGPMAEWLVARAGISAGATVLDLGCGKGAVTLAAARAAGPGGHVTGIDLAGPMLKHARAAARHARQHNVAFQPGDAEDPRPFRSATFDAIVAGYLIQFLPRPAHAARRWRRLLKPGGVLALTWGAAQDPRWAPVMAAVDAHVPDTMVGFEAFFRRPPFHHTAAVNQMLAVSGYADVITVTREFTTVYDTPEQWWATCLSQAPGAVAWRHIPEERLPAARRDAFTALDSVRDSDGKLVRILTFACTSGTTR